MKIQEFLELSEGQWIAQRTSYYLGQEKFDNGKSNLTVERLSPQQQEIVELCQQHQINSDKTLGAIKSSWDSADQGQAKANFSLLVFVPHQDNHQQGKLLQKVGTQDSLMSGHYLLAEDEALTLTVAKGKSFFEERIWFASPNLRLRTSLVKQEDNYTTTAFYSEIRRMPPKAE